MTNTGYKTGVNFPKSVILFKTNICNATRKIMIKKSVNKVLLIIFFFYYSLHRILNFLHLSFLQVFHDKNFI